MSISTDGGYNEADLLPGVFKNGVDSSWQPPSFTSKQSKYTSFEGIKRSCILNTFPSKSTVNHFDIII